MSTKEILIEQFKAGYDENGWFVALKNALANITAEQALWKPAGTEHSVWEMVYHLTFWNDRWRRRYLDQPQETKGPIVISETFQAKESASEEEWQEAVARLYSVMDFWKDALANITEEKLNEPVSERYTDAWFYPLANMMIHNAYHIGQIVIIRKVAGNWDASKGVS